MRTATPRLTSSSDSLLMPGAARENRERREYARAAPAA